MFHKLASNKQIEDLLKSCHLDEHDAAEAIP